MRIFLGLFLCLRLLGWPCLPGNVPQLTTRAGHNTQRSNATGLLLEQFSEKQFFFLEVRFRMLRMWPGTRVAGGPAAGTAAGAEPRRAKRGGQAPATPLSPPATLCRSTSAAGERRFRTDPDGFFAYIRRWMWWIKNELSR